jgi:hypothetical protein
MFKKDMTKLSPKGTLHKSVNKAASARTMPSAATGGGPASFQSYAKATPMAQSQAPAPPPDGLGSGSFGGIAD